MNPEARGIQKEYDELFDLNSDVNKYLNSVGVYQKIPTSNVIFDIDNCTSLEFSIDKYFEDTRRFPTGIKESQFIKKNIRLQTFVNG